MNCPKCGLPVALLDRDWNSTAVQHAKCPVNELTVLQSRLTELEQGLYRYNQAVAKIFSDGSWNAKNHDQVLEAQQKGAALIRHILNDAVKRQAIDAAMKGDKG